MKFQNQNLNEIQHINVSYKGLQDKIFKNSLKSQITELKGESVLTNYFTEPNSQNHDDTLNRGVETSELRKESIGEVFEYEKEEQKTETHETPYQNLDLIRSLDKPYKYELMIDEVIERLGQSVNFGYKEDKLNDFSSVKPL